ncbi:protein phosphatase 2C domain-containing protein [Nostoc sp. FACHB-87]|uniref:protein phosphatase 2C domain-containing protein n=1 Tax=Nostocaceae TaxID=1162 RepID=UPI0016857B03|nr:MULTISPECIES: protein phosphatase 2C domain-containing protein [Nostocaceae]MBD2457339.1 protein phosphatase 2C domain-containing protein [Nostoc sp. FACHB-87]MBD2478514.1 protein phosphatase 2C domain-containing protein [Anabaena sp. FACHB-83]
MENDAATLYCPNELCQAANPLTHKFCQRCSTPLPKRYLWVVGDVLNVGSPGEILADRYLVLNKSVVLDTKPGLLPHGLETENLETIRAYLRLIPYRLHIPQVYGVLSFKDGRSRKEILLLEKPPLFTEPTTDSQLRLCPQLTTAWRNATSIRQLNWLWQLAHLWQPLASEGVASSLLEAHLLRVEGPLVRLLELRVDTATPTLSDLGEFWQQLLPDTKPVIAEFVNQVSNYLIHGEINSAEVLISVLDQGLAELGELQSPKIKIITKTDTGPKRQRNEDACYPPSGTMLSKPPQATALAIVCDGIGGHEGGNVASNLAIDTIQQQVQQLTKVPYNHIDPSLLLADLEQAVAVANDKISQRNDSENRQGRKRMGTTLVMALPVAHEMYITHVGDSRAYWITRDGCYQVTLDDDVASREVRLGYAIYREAVQQSGSGSLVQALGMSSSTALHPTAQRFILDEDAVFLLTSDGLSDFDRVEEYWETEILPILTEETDLVTVADKLLEIANTKNGHDNVTIALVHYQVKYVEPELTLKAVIVERPSTTTAKVAPKPLQPTLLEDISEQKTLIPKHKSTSLQQLPLHLIVPMIIAIAAGSLGLLVRGLFMSPPFLTTDPSPTVQPTPTATNERSLNNLAPGWVITNSQAITLDDQKLETGSFLQVVEVEPGDTPNAQESVIQLRLCSAENTSSPQPNKPLRVKLAQLQRQGISVLQANETSSCNNLSQLPDS